MESIDELRQLRHALENSFPVGESGLHKVPDAEVGIYVGRCVHEMSLYVERCRVGGTTAAPQRIDCSNLDADQLQFCLSEDQYPAYKLAILDFSGCTIRTIFEIVGSPNPERLSLRTPPERFIHSVLLRRAHCEMVSFTRLNALELACSSATLSLFFLADSLVECLDMRSTSVSKTCQLSNDSLTYFEAKLTSIPLGMDLLKTDVYFMSLFASTIKDHFSCYRSSFRMVPNVIGASLPDDFSLQPSQIDGDAVLDVMEYISSRHSLVVDVASERSPVAAMYRGLRLATKRTGGSHELEAVYFARELRAERKSRRGPYRRIDRVLSWLYDSISEYGTSVQRSLLWFVGWNLAFALFFVLVVEFGPRVWRLDILLPFGLTLGVPPAAISAVNPAYVGAEAVGLALQNAFNPLAILSANAAVKVSNAALALACLAQSLGSVGIAALALLALRTRFQRGSGGS